MALTLGIHVGHDAGCAVVRDGELVAAVQLERISRVKHHAIDSLSNVLPVTEVLATIGATLDDVDRIVSSFQAACVGGFGLDRPLIEPSFSLFDPFEPRHHALSHHLAHAHCAAAYAPQGDVAVLVSDLAGSATQDGLDFAKPFADWYGELTSSAVPIALRSECLSLYHARPGTPFELVHREFRVPNSGAQSHVCGIGSLYENVTQAVFRRPHTHGSLMAMAAFGERSPSARPMVDVDGERVVFRNDWQHEVYADAVLVGDAGAFALPFAKAAALAARCQDATEEVLLAYGRRAARMVGSRHLALGGGTFLNILGNTRLAQSGLFDTVSLPSAPHDAGIAIGCAFHGATALGDTPRRVVRDRLGPIPPAQAAELALERASRFVTWRPTTPAEIARRLVDGQIVARSAGRSEFGPRALGGRSLLASPASEAAKDRLNRIKGREPWRPVAPIVAAEAMARVFDTPADSPWLHSPWMTFSHTLPPAAAQQLAALRHPDGSTRAQSLERAQDPWLHDLLRELEAATGYPVVVNTSLNGPAQPILETPDHALAFLLEHDDVDALLLDEVLVERRPLAHSVGDLPLRPSPDAYVLRGPASPDGSRSCVVRVDGASRAIRSEALATLFDGGGALTLAQLRDLDPELDLAEVRQLLVRGFVTL